MMTTTMMIIMVITPEVFPLDDPSDDYDGYDDYIGNCFDDDDDDDD